MKNIIQNDNGEFIKYEAHELPDGCIISGHYYSCSFFGKVKKGWLAYSFRHEESVNQYDNGIELSKLDDIKIHDIVDENGNSTHVKRWLATDMDGTSFLYGKDPIRYEESFNTSGTLNPSCRGKNTCGQTWKDEPWVVWERI
jgi:hypothetical protein